MRRKKSWPYNEPWRNAWKRYAQEPTLPNREALEDCEAEYEMRGRSFPYDAAVRAELTRRATELAAEIESMPEGKYELGRGLLKDIAASLKEMSKEDPKT